MDAWMPTPADAVVDKRIQANNTMRMPGVLNLDDIGCTGITTQYRINPYHEKQGSDHVQRTPERAGCFRTSGRTSRNILI
jgi:hypothetical protein